MRESRQEFCATFHGSIEDDRQAATSRRQERAYRTGESAWFPGRRSQVVFATSSVLMASNISGARKDIDWFGWLLQAHPLDGAIGTLYRREALAAVISSKNALAKQKWHP
jgi:hypothetical protein